MTWDLDLKVSFPLTNLLKGDKFLTVCVVSIFVIFTVASIVVQVVLLLLLALLFVQNTFHQKEIFDLNMYRDGKYTKYSV